MDTIFLVSCVNISQTAESQHATVYLGGKCINDVSSLLAGILNYCRVHTHTWIHMHSTYTVPTYTTHTLTHKHFCIGLHDDNIIIRIQFSSNASINFTQPK